MIKSSKLVLYLAVSLTISIGLADSFAQAPAPAPEKNSFSEVTSKLDPGGNLYFYISTEQFVQNIEKQIESLRQLISSSTAGDSPENTKNISSAFDVVLDIYGKSGIKEISGVGMSSAKKDDFYRNVIFMHHYKENNKGKIWSIFGNAPHKIEGLTMLPADTVLAFYGDLDSKMIWDWFNEELKASGNQEINDKLQQGLLSAKNFGFDVDSIMSSLDKENGMILTFDRNTKINIPTGEKVSSIPKPSLVMIVKVKDDTLFNLIKSQMPMQQPTAGADQNQAKANPDEIKKILSPFPIPYLFTFPVIIQKDNYLFMATGEDIVNEILDVRSGKKPGLASTDEFKKISANIPVDGNSFKFVSPEFGKTIADVQKQMMSSDPADKNAKNENELLAKMLPTGWETFSLFGVMQNNPEGFLFSSNCSHNLATMIASQATIAPAAILAGMLLPALSNAREKARIISCSSNLKGIGLALRMYSMDNGDKFPEPDGVAGLELLRKGKYLENTKMFTCPSTDINAAGSEALTDETCSYVYFGGFSESDNPDIPIVIEYPDNHRSETNVLFLDGHVNSFKGMFDSYADIIDAIKEKQGLDEAICKKLLEKAQKLEASDDDGNSDDDSMTGEKAD